MNWPLRNLAFWRRKQRNAELDEELRGHLTLVEEEEMQSGRTKEEAAAAARRHLGNVAITEEVTRDAWGWRWLVDLGQDIRFSLRMLRKSPGFTAVAILTLALGIGANTAIFSLIDALLLKSLPVQDPQELVVLQWTAHERPAFVISTFYGDCNQQNTSVQSSSCSFSRPFYDDLRAHSDMLQGLTASGGGIQLNLAGNGPASIVSGQIVAGNYFDVLGVRPLLGRMLQSADEDPAANMVTVLNYGFWQRAFGGSPSAVGKTITLNGVPSTIVGVAEQRFVSLTPGSVADAYVPLSARPRMQPRWNPKFDAADSVWMVIIARLKPGVSRKKAETAVSLLFRNDMLHGEKPLSKAEDNPRVNLLLAQAGLVGARGRYSTPLFILMLAVGIILLIACANVAGLLLARSAARQKEMALRLALGAGRWRLVRQLLTESVLLSIFGGALGIVVAYWGAHAVVRMVAGTSTQPLGMEATLDVRVLLFTTGITLLAGIFFGLAPATRGMRVDLTPTLKQGTGSSPAGGRSRSRRLNVGNSLVVAQVALTIVVLVGAGLLERTLQNLRDIDPGFDTSNILNFGVNPVLAGYKGTQIDVALANLQERFRAIPGVTSVSYSNAVLLSGNRFNTSFRLLGSTDKSGFEADIVLVGPEFFSTMKIPSRKGRDFSPADFSAASSAIAAANAAGQNQDAQLAAVPAAPTSAVVNEEFVRKFFGNANPIGQRFAFQEYPGETDAQRKDPGFVVIGVVGNARSNSLRTEVQPTVYLPAVGYEVNFELRTAVNPTAIISAVRNTVNQMDNNLPIYRIQTESQSIDNLLYQERLIARLSSFFGALALALACVGLYGLLSYEVSRRTREIGIRMALGAGQRNVLQIVVGQGLALAVVGVVFGIAAAFGVTRYLGSVLFGVHPGDPKTLLAVAVILMLVALAACFVPARRATRVDPMVALRNE